MPDRTSPGRAAAAMSAYMMLLIVFGIGLSHLRLTGAVITELVIFAGLPLVMTIVWDRAQLRDLFRLYPLTFRGIQKAVGLGIIAFAMAQGTAYLMLALVDRFGGKMPELYESLLQAPYVTAVLVGAVIPSLCEEIAFRGYIQRHLRSFGHGSAIILTGVLFGLMHGSVVRLLPLSLLGIIFAHAVQRTGSLIPSMIMHFTNNFVALTLSFMLSPGSETNAEITFPATLAWGIATPLLILLAWRVGRSFGPDDLAHPDAAAATLAHNDPPRTIDRLAFGFTLLPGLLIYSYLGARELIVVFGPH